MTNFKWDLARRRDPRSDPNDALHADQRKLTFLRHIGDRHMSITADDLRREPEADVREHADDIQRQLDYDLELCRWAADALPSRERRRFVRQAELSHRDVSAWLIMITGEVFSINPPHRRRSGGRRE